MESTVKENPTPLPNPPQPFGGTDKDYEDESMKLDIDKNMSEKSLVDTIHKEHIEEHQTLQQKQMEELKRFQKASAQERQRMMTDLRNEMQQFLYEAMPTTDSSSLHSNLGPAHYIIMSQLSPLFTQFLAWQRLMQISQLHSEATKETNEKKRGANVELLSGRPKKRSRRGTQEQMEPDSGEEPLHTHMTRAQVKRLGVTLKEPSSDESGVPKETDPSSKEPSNIIKNNEQEMEVDEEKLKKPEEKEDKSVSYSAKLSGYSPLKSTKFEYIISSTPVIIGRNHPSVNVDLSNYTDVKTISHIHAKIYKEGQTKYRLESLGRNGTKVNEDLYKKNTSTSLTTYLKDQDVIEIGKLKMRFELSYAE